MKTPEELQEDFEYVQNKIENEGLGYFILDYTDSSSMPDKVSKKLFEKAEKALRRFQEYIEMNAEI